MARCLAVLAGVVLLCAPVLAYSDYEASRCVSWGTKCPGWMANTAGHGCRSGVSPDSQSSCCLKAACHWCTSHRHIEHCKFSGIIRKCFSWNPAYQCNGNQNNNNNNNGGCYQNNQRAQGAPGHPSVQYKPCCDKSAKQVSVAGQWGKFCKVGSNNNNNNNGGCYQNNQRAQGAPGHPPVQYKPCCDKNAVQVGVSGQWGKFCKVQNNKASVQNQGQAVTNGQCTWRGNLGNRVVISTKNSASGNWRNWGNGIKYKPWDHNPHAIDGAGSSTLTYNFQVPQSGQYYITMKSNAAHHTEYNDCWLQFPTGLKLAKPGHEFWSGNWVKAYQNRGWGAREIFSADHDPHQMSTGWLNAGQTYQIKVAGRSSQFEIETIMIIKCGGTCWRWDGAISGSIWVNQVSSCY